MAALTPSGSRRFVQPARSRFSCTVSEPNTPLPPGICTMPSAAISFGGAWVMSRPSSTMAPRSASTTPLIALNSVDLPAPFVPSSATISPSLQFEVDVAQHRSLAVAGLDAADEQQGACCRGAGRRAPPERAAADCQTCVMSSSMTSADAAQDERADDEDRQHHEHADPDVPGVGRPIRRTGRTQQSGDGPQ